MGIELSEVAARYARDRMGLQVVAGELSSQFSQSVKPFDVVVLFHVIEHVPDPIGFLELCRRITRPNGRLILKTPNVASLVARLTGAGWHWLCPPAHLWLYSPPTLERLLKRVGYQPRYLRSTRGDAHNNLFAILSGAARHGLSQAQTQSLLAHRRSLPVRMIEGLTEFLYYPLRLTVDPWLATKMWQPELYAVASARG